MKCKIITIIVLFMSVVLLNGMIKRAKIEETQEIIEPIELTQPIQSFGFDILKNIKNNGEENIFLSPLSIHQALSMLLNGAEDETYTELAATLNVSNFSIEQINNANKMLLDMMNQKDEDLLIDIANSIWYKNGMAVKNPFLTANANYYNAQIEAIDFSAPSSPSKINSWVSEKTHNKINKIISGEIDPMLRMMLINAVYFKGNWEIPFNPARTRQVTFDNRIKCQMMSNRDQYPYAETNRAQIVDLPYGDSEYSMMVVLPNESQKVDEIVQSLNNKTWQEWQQQLTVTRGALSLPKFEMDYSVDLNDILKTMGMKSAFSPQEADLSGISELTDLFVNKVLHKTYLKVDEEGTEAAAVTVVGIETTSIKPTGFVMNVNRPFICIIHNNDNVIFTGIINTPTM